MPPSPAADRSSFAHEYLSNSFAVQPRARIQYARARIHTYARMLQGCLCCEGLSSFQSHLCGGFRLCCEAAVRRRRRTWRTCCVLEVTSSCARWLQRLPDRRATCVAVALRSSSPAAAAGRGHCVRQSSYRVGVPCQQRERGQEGQRCWRHDAAPALGAPVHASSTANRE